MQRRTFIRLVGGGTIAAATAATGVGAWALRPAYPARSLEAWTGPGAEPDPRLRALAYAITAPNPHNLQPWLADLREPGVITLRTDPQRVLPQTDPWGRQILIGHGCFLELLAIALAQQGLHADVALWPEGELPPSLGQWDSRPIARVRLRPGAARDPLFDHILRRHTPKVDFDTARSVDPAQLRHVLDGAGPGVRADGTVAPQRLAQLRELCWQSAQVELLTPATVMESVRLTRVGPAEILRHRDGISINGAAPRIAAALGLFDRSRPPAEGSAAYRQMMDRFSGHSRTAMGFAWISTQGNSRSQQVDAGRAYVRMQLRATAIGVGMHPMSQALQEFPQMRAHHDRAHRMLVGRPSPAGPADPTVQMFCRLGYPQDTVQATPRRPLAAFVTA